MIMHAHVSLLATHPRGMMGMLLCWNVTMQESVKTRHPQLLYESKLYKILQGGGARSQPLPQWQYSSTFCN